MAEDDDVVDNIPEADVDIESIAAGGLREAVYDSLVGIKEVSPSLLLSEALTDAVVEGVKDIIIDMEVVGSTGGVAESGIAFETETV